MEKQAIVTAAEALLLKVQHIPFTEEWRALLEAIRNEYQRQVAFDMKRAADATTIGHDNVKVGPHVDHHHVETKATSSKKA